jgi:hypothetical protein
VRLDVTERAAALVVQLFDGAQRFLGRARRAASVGSQVERVATILEPLREAFDGARAG